MSFVFRGSRGDIENAFSGFIPERRAVRIHGGGRTFTTNPMALLATVLLLFMILNSHQMSPNFLLWLGLGLFLMATSLRMYAMCQHLQAQAQAHAAAVAAAAGGLVGHTELRLRMPPSIAFATRGRLQGLRLQLALLDRDFDDLDYDALRALDSDNPPGVHSMSESEINALPVHKYKCQSQQPSVDGHHGEGTSMQPQNCTTPKERKADSEPENKGRGHEEELTCSVCLEQVNDGELVRSLPCLHQFHVACIDPWLRQQATCPVCKFRVGSGWQGASESDTGPFMV
eukprot:TRINITY_DN2651_c0_g1_i1.p1 TRINITY_DN2651_c0_g1~~TRINITY_DN2651_c0_g1_i1.p1  ORF type:complete len:286 (+),score=48.92 TRINITY_DN2651_c0_g1_i1:266-1123(+)